MVEPGHSIPFELYSAVAGILAYLYRQKVEERMRRQRQAQQAQQSMTPMRLYPASMAAGIHGAGGGM
jgi:flagellar biosynthetic protein FlhB